MKLGFTTCLFYFLAIVGAAQQYDPASLINQITSTTNDSVRFQLYGRLSDYYIEKKIDSALYWSLVQSPPKWWDHQPLEHHFPLILS